MEETLPLGLQRRVMRSRVITQTLLHCVSRQRHIIAQPMCTDSGLCLPPFWPVRFKPIEIFNACPDSVTSLSVDVNRQWLHFSVRTMCVLGGTYSGACLSLVCLFSACLSVCLSVCLFARLSFCSLLSCLFPLFRLAFCVDW